LSKQGHRKGEEEGRRLTPGERAINWAKAFAVIIPLFGAGWVSNSQTVKDWVAGEVETHEEYVEAVIEKPEVVTRTIIKECTIIREECGDTEAITKRINKWHGPE